LSLVVAISLLLYFFKKTETTNSEKFSEFPDAHSQKSACGHGSGDHHRGAFDASWAHIDLL
jgi:hypothetical protein